MSRYSRQVTVPEIGAHGQERLRSSRVVVVGAGGLGIPVCSYLVASGVGVVTVIDNDAVDESNLARQVLFEHDDIGRPKLDALLPKLARQNQDVLVDGINTRLTPETAGRLIQGADLVIDASDNFITRYAISDAALQAGIPHVWGAVFRFEGSVGVFPPTPDQNYQALYPEQPPAYLASSCDSGGVVGSVCGLVGSLMASEALQFLVGLEPPLWGRTATIDMRSLSFSVKQVEAPALSLGHHAPASSPIDVRAADVDTEFTQNRRSVLVDVRTDGERAAGHVVGSLHVPINSLWDWARSFSPGEAEHIVFYCKTGSRSRQAAQIWHAVNGNHQRTSSVIGGYQALLSEGGFTCL